MVSPRCALAFTLPYAATVVAMSSTIARCLPAGPHRLSDRWTAHVEPTPTAEDGWRCRRRNTFRACPVRAASRLQRASPAWLLMRAHPATPAMRRLSTASSAARAITSAHAIVAVDQRHSGPFLEHAHRGMQVCSAFDARRVAAGRPMTPCPSEPLQIGFSHQRDQEQGTPPFVMPRRRKAAPMNGEAVGVDARCAPLMIGALAEKGRRWS